MSENKDVYAQAKGQMRLSERIEAFLPGFRGYKEKELRRESDKLLRNHIYMKLTHAKDNYEHGRIPCSFYYVLKFKGEC
jgi:hypothetical protein